MWKAALVGALALTAVGVVPVSADEGQIAQAKATLNLTPEQARHWPRVAAALRAAARQSQASSPQSSDNDGLVQRVRSRAASVGARAAAIRRVIAAAGPLVRTLTPEQKQAARSMVRSMGYGHLASRL